MSDDRLSNANSTSSRIAICSWSLRSNDPQALLDRLEQLQIAAVQLRLNQILDDEARWGDAVDELRDHGVWITSGAMGLVGEHNHRFEVTGRSNGILNDQSWFANRFIAEQAARLSDRACIGLVCTNIGPIPRDASGPERAKLADRLGALAEIFANYGINLAIETGQAQIEDLDSLLEQINLPNLGVNFDPAGIILAGLGDPIDALRRVAPRVRQAHVRDAVPARKTGGTGREVAVGQGVVDWDGFFGIATAILPPIQFVIEREARLATDSDLTAARNLIAYHLRPRSGVRLES